MRYWVFVLALLLSACHPPPTIVTPAGRTAYTADQITLRVNELEQAAITANRTGGLALAPTRTLVEFCVVADQTLAATPAGWPVTLATAWTVAKIKLPPNLSPVLTAAMSALDVVLATTGAP